MGFKRHLRIGTRKSKLAMLQAQHLGDTIKISYPDWTVELVPIATQGDRFLEVPVSSIEGKGVFLKELEDALLDGAIDCAVHSMKDVPTEIHPELKIAAISKREDPRDVLVAREKRLSELPQGACIGTGSNRRKYQLLAFRPDFQVKPIRGNVDTRIRKWQEGHYDALVLALAGLKRLGLEGMISQVLPFEVMLPAAGQGAIGIELRVKDRELLKSISFLDDGKTHAAVDAERAFLEGAGGGCSLPISVYGEVCGNELQLTARIVEEKNIRLIEGKASGALEDAKNIGKRLARKLLRTATDKTRRHE